MAVDDANIDGDESKPYVKMVSPEEIAVSEFNERFGELNVAGLVDSVEERGVIEPPLVRHENGKLRVIVGQRRTMAALQAGLDEIPVVVVDFYDDTDALIASITENYEGFREDVHPSDRARAIDRIKEMTGWSYSQIDEELGLGDGTASRWHERARSEWDGTGLAPVRSEDGIQDTDEHSDSAKGSENVGEPFISPDVADTLTDGTLQEIRRITGGGMEGEELAKKVADAGLHEKEMQQVKKAIERGQDADAAINELTKEKEAERETKIQIQMTIGGEVGTAVKTFAEENQLTEQQVIRDAVMDYLERQGAL